MGGEIMMLLTFVFFALLHFSPCNGANCKSIHGSWYNQLGSEVFLQHDNGLLVGLYRSDLERETGQPGTLTHSPLYGSMPYVTNGAVFGFSVSFRNSTATKAWTGQCEVCSDGEEMLVTTWVMRVAVDTCRDKWKSTLIGQDVFTRTSPSDLIVEEMANENDVPYSINYGEVTSHGNRPIGRTKRASNADCTDISGYWYNDVGSEVILKQANTGVITGEYRTAVERNTGDAGTSHTKVQGYRQMNTPNGTMSLFVVWKEGGSISGFVGQCHVCSNGDEAILETTWLLRVKVSRCEDNWKATLHGQNTFTRHEQKAGPRKAAGVHTPSDDGESDGQEIITHHVACSHGDHMVGPVPWRLLVAMLLWLTYLG